MEIIFHLGPRKCGKSLFVEEQLANVKTKLYIGTLDKEHAEFKKSIHEHQNRRDFSWLLYEITFNLMVDMDNIGTILANENAPTCVMLDGILSWIIQTSNLNPSIRLTEHLQRLIDLIKRSQQSWYLVDVNAEAFQDNGPIWMEYREIHRKLITELNIKSIINWNYE